MAGTYSRIIGKIAQCGFLGTQEGMLWQEEFVAGELDHQSYESCIPGNSGKTLVKLTLTGEELFRLIENGRTVESDGKYQVIMS